MVITDFKKSGLIFDQQVCRVKNLMSKTKKPKNKATTTTDAVVTDKDFQMKCALKMGSNVNVYPKDESVEDDKTENSLSGLTKRFMRIAAESKNGIVELNIIAEKLGAKKRRIYDITNVLEGINLVEKKSKNNILLKCGMPMNDEQHLKIVSLRNQIVHDQTLEQSLDHEIAMLRSEIQNSFQSPYCYVSHEDVYNIPELEEEMILAVKAPPGAQLETTHDDHTKLSLLCSQPFEVFVLTREELVSPPRTPRSPQAAPAVPQRPPTPPRGGTTIPMLSLSEEGRNLSARLESTSPLHSISHLDDSNQFSNFSPFAFSQDPSPIKSQSRSFMSALPLELDECTSARIAQSSAVRLSTRSTFYNDNSNGQSSPWKSSRRGTLFSIPDTPSNGFDDFLHDRSSSPNKQILFSPQSSPEKRLTIMTDLNGVVDFHTSQDGLIPIGNTNSSNMFHDNSTIYDAVVFPHAC